MAWLGRTSDKEREEDTKGVKPGWLSVEERLDQIAKAQMELNRQAQEIKNIANAIVQELGSQERAAEILNKLLRLLSEMPPALRSIESQFALLRDGQSRLQDDINHLETMISKVSEQLTMARP